MAPTITSFFQFLASEEPHFKTLSGVCIRKEGGTPILIRTSLFAEALISIGNRNYLPCLPLSGMADSNLARTCAKLRQIYSPAITEYRLLSGEISLPDSLGHEELCDLVLHEIPEGESLDKAISHIATSRIRAALSLLKQEMLKIGFRHGNLKPSNLLYTEDGHIYPIRYHYAQLGADHEEISAEFDRIEAFVAEHPEVAEVGEYTSPMEYLNRLPYDEVFQMHDMMRRVRKDGLYGYLDCDDKELIAPQYTYAEDFFENRAVVQTTEGKMGVIDSEGRWIIKPIYDMLGFEDGIFNARIGQQWIKIDYLGITIK